MEIVPRNYDHEHVWTFPKLQKTRCTICGRTMEQTIPGYLMPCPKCKKGNMIVNKDSTAFCNECHWGGAI